MGKPLGAPGAPGVLGAPDSLASLGAPPGPLGSQRSPRPQWPTPDARLQSRHGTQGSARHPRVRCAHTPMRTPCGDCASGHPASHACRHAERPRIDPTVRSPQAARRRAHRKPGLPHPSQQAPPSPPGHPKSASFPQTRVDAARALHAPPESNPGRALPSVRAAGLTQTQRQSPTPASTPYPAPLPLWAPALYAQSAAALLPETKPHASDRKAQRAPQCPRRP